MRSPGEPLLQGDSYRTTPFLGQRRGTIAKRIDARETDLRGLAAMRVLHIADIHGRIDFLEWSRGTDAPTHDVLALSGDFIHVVGREPVWKQRRDILIWLRAQRTTTIGCSGNCAAPVP